MVLRLLPLVSSDGLYKMVVEHETRVSYVDEASQRMRETNSYLRFAVENISRITGRYEDNLRLSLCVYDMMNYTKNVPFFSPLSVFSGGRTFRQDKDFLKGIEDLIEEDTRMSRFIKGFMKVEGANPWAQATVQLMYGLLHQQAYVDSPKGSLRLCLPEGRMLKFDLLFLD